MPLSPRRSGKGSGRGRGHVLAGFRGALNDDPGPRLVRKTPPNPCCTSPAPPAAPNPERAGECRVLEFDYLRSRRVWAVCQPDQLVLGTDQPIWENDQAISEHDQAVSG